MLTHQVLGHDDIQQRFSALCQQSKLPHAWMIYGMEGIGKAMLAKQLAKHYLCECLNDSGQACGQCHACQMVQSESHPDLMQLGLLWDEKKKRFRRDVNVEQVRQVLDFLALSGMESERRVVILDDANRMNLAASNALLKGLEEPASGALLLIVCHDLSALPETIRSRCMLEHCSPLGDDDVRILLKKNELPEHILELSVNLAKGCPGQVEVLKDEKVATACLQWQAMTQSLQHADLGEIEAWLQQCTKFVPHDLIVTLLVEPLQYQMEHWDGDYTTSEAFYTVIQSLLTWQHDGRAHALRPVSSLLARILQVRKVLKQRM